MLLLVLLLLFRSLFVNLLPRCCLVQKAEAPTDTDTLYGGCTVESSCPSRRPLSLGEKRRNATQRDATRRNKPTTRQDSSCVGREPSGKLEPRHVSTNFLDSMFLFPNVRTHTSLHYSTSSDSYRHHRRRRRRQQEDQSGQHCHPNCLKAIHHGTSSPVRFHTSDWTVQ